MIWAKGEDRMVQWMKSLYLDDDLKESVLTIKHKFKFKKYPGSYYFIILPEGNDMPEIMRCVFLKQPYYKKINYDIIGIATDKKNALDLLCDMIEDAIKVTGKVNIRQYYNAINY